ncbi:MAG: fibronectin type III domain-containing protein [Methylococcales bacterium]
MNSQHFVCNETSGKQSGHRIKNTVLIWPTVSALCLLLGGHPAQALISCEQNEDCGGGGGGAPTEEPVENPVPEPTPQPVPPPSGVNNPLCRQFVAPPRPYENGFIAPADYDGDGRIDPSVVTYTGTWAIDFSSQAGFGTFDKVLKHDTVLMRKSHTPGMQPIPLPADYDGDCMADRGAKDPAGNWYIDYAVNGFGTWDVTLPGFGDASYQPVPADYDGDGKVDLSTKDHGGNWYIDYAGNGYGDWDEIYPGFGGPNFVPVPADYDGDGKADFSTRDGDHWYVDWSSNGRGEEAWDAIYPGFGDPANFIPVPADYDGDGKADFSSRDTSDNWYIDWSSNGRAEQNWDAIYTGFAGTDFVAAPGDYDGDSRADLASVRYNGQWLIDHAGNGFGNWDQIWNWLPPAPSQFSVTSTTTSSITLGWKDNSSTEDGFTVRKKDINIILPDGSWGNYDAGGANSTKFTFTGLDADSKYCFKIFARTAYGNSEVSPEVCARTKETPPPPKPTVAGISLGYRLRSDVQCTGAVTFQLNPLTLTGSSGIDTAQTLRTNDGTVFPSGGYCYWTLPTAGLRAGNWSIHVLGLNGNSCQVTLSPGANIVSFTAGIAGCSTGLSYPVAPLPSPPPPPTSGGGGKPPTGPGTGRPPVQEQ